MSTQKNLITLCFATVFTLGLAACGGGGGDAPVTGMTDDTVVPTIVVPTIVGEVIPSGTAFTLPEGLADDFIFTVPQGTSVPVPGVGTFECVTGPCTIDIANNEVTTTGDIEVVSLADDLPADVLMALASAIAPAGPTPPTSEQLTAAAATKVTAIAAEATQEADAGLGGTGTPASTQDAGVGEYTLEIKYDGGQVVSITVEGATNDDDKSFTMNDMGMHVLGPNDDGETEVAIVYTDIEAPTDIPFVMADDKGRYTLNANDDDGGEPQSLTFAEAHSGLATLTDTRVTVPAPSGSVTLMGDDADTDDVKENEYSGTFDGAPGTFTCTDADNGCIVTIVDSKITGMATVHFTPEEDATVSEPDGDYLHYGFWLKNTTDEDGAITYNEVEAFADSSAGESNGNEINTVEGSARYKGGAAGVYVRNVYLPSTTGEKELDTATSGHFTADASLMVYFSGNDVALNKQNTVTGTIDNFALAGGEANEWSVALEGDRADDANMITGTANGGGDKGSFSGTFHGPTELTEDLDDVDNRDMPHTVVGEFDANFSNGAVVGGFGARKQ